MDEFVSLETQPLLVAAANSKHTRTGSRLHIAGVKCGLVFSDPIGSIDGLD